VVILFRLARGTSPVRRSAALAPFWLFSSSLLVTFFPCHFSPV
jgi:hypothetical protein